MAALSRRKGGASKTQRTQRTQRTKKCAKARGTGSSDDEWGVFFKAKHPAIYFQHLPCSGGPGVIVLDQFAAPASHLLAFRLTEARRLAQRIRERQMLKVYRWM